MYLQYIFFVLQQVEINLFDLNYYDWNDYEFCPFFKLLGIELRNFFIFIFIWKYLTLLEYLSYDYDDYDLLNVYYY